MATVEVQTLVVEVSSAPDYAALDEKVSPITEPEAPPAPVTVVEEVPADELAAPAAAEEVGEESKPEVVVLETAPAETVSSKEEQPAAEEEKAVEKTPVIEAPAEPEAAAVEPEAEAEEPAVEKTTEPAVPVEEETKVVAEEAAPKVEEEALKDGQEEEKAVVSE